MMRLAKNINDDYRMFGNRYAIKCETSFAKLIMQRFNETPINDRPFIQNVFNKTTIEDHFASLK